MTTVNDDRGLVALAERWPHDCPDHQPTVNCAAEAFGERGVFLPEGMPERIVADPPGHRYLTATGCGHDAEISRLRAALEGLTVHGISGYEWECDACHYHFMNRSCHISGHGTPDHDAYVDDAGNECDHGKLLDRTAVLAEIKRMLGEPG